MNDTYEVENKLWLVSTAKDQSVFNESVTYIHEEIGKIRVYARKSDCPVIARNLYKQASDLQYRFKLALGSR